MDKKKKKGGSLFSGMNIKRKRKKKKTPKPPKPDENQDDPPKVPADQAVPAKADFGDSSDFTIAEDSGNFYKILFLFLK